MVLQKTSIRTRIESQNEQREKKIAQLNDFIARFSAGTRSSQVNSRKKEVERLATSELARSNIARPFIRFDMVRPSGKHVLEFEDVNKSYDQKDGKTEHVINNFSATVQRGDKVILMGRNGQGKTTLLKALLANGPGVDETDVSIDSGTVKWGHEAQIGYFAQDHTGSIAKGTTVAEWLHSFDPAGHQGRHPRHSRPDALPRRRGAQEDRRALRRRSRPPALLQDHVAEAQHPRPRRAHQPP